ncbi:MAG TPA: flagellar hook-length control protein FliK [Alphaproteobacteria bacterium]|nr:flagellar hook-length control protein FliK [Alphaproteobacteria bacterium]
MALSILPASGFPVSSLSSGGALGTGDSADASSAFAGIFSLLQGQKLADTNIDPEAKTNVILFAPDQNSLQNFISELGSDADLEDLLAAIKNDGVLSNAILVALTPGTPSSEFGQTLSGNGVATLSLEELSSLVSSNQDALSHANVLLVATPLQPSNMEDLAEQISNAFAGLSNQNSLYTINEQTNGSITGDDLLSEDQETGVQVFLVKFTDADQTQDFDSDVFEISEEAVLNDTEHVLSDEDLNEEDSLDPSLLSALLTSHPQNKIAPQGFSEHASDRAKAVSAFATPSSDDALYSPLAPFEAAQNGKAGFQSQGYVSGGSAHGHAHAHGSSSSSFGGAMDLDGVLSSASDRFMQDGSLSAHSSFELSASDTALLQAMQNTSSQLNAATSPVLSHSSAAAHGASQQVSASLTNNFQNGELKNQSLSLELDPPELGRVQVHLSLEKGEAMKVRIVADNDDALQVLKRDVHNLREALEQAGIKMDDSSLSFDMSQDSSAFEQAMQHQNGQAQHSSRHDTSFALSGVDGAFVDGMVNANGVEIIDTELGIHVHPETGQVHYNILA